MEIAEKAGVAIGATGVSGEIVDGHLVQSQIRTAGFIEGALFVHLTKGRLILLRTILAIALLLTSSSAFAAGDAPSTSSKPAKPHCEPLAKFKSANDDPKTHLTVLTPGQFHFVEGIYVGSPTTPEGWPPGNGALLVTRDGIKEGFVAWTRGSDVCTPIMIDEKMLKMVMAIKSGKDETLDGGGTDPNELKL